MQALVRSARYAALVIFVAFAMHNLNGAYIEPRYLGFGSYADYADLGKLMNASRAVPWLLSGLGHVATGFLLTGISHVIGRQTLFLLSDANPEMQASAYMTATVVRIWVNGLAQIGLGWFAVQLSWLGWKTGTLPRAFVLFGFLSGAAGLLMAVAYIPIYLFTVLVWALWLAMVWQGVDGAGRA